MPVELQVLMVLIASILLPFFYFAFLIYPRRELSEETKKRPRSFVSNALFREFWYFLSGPLKRKLVEWDVRPNTLTWWGLFLSLAAGVCFGFGLFGAGGFCVIFAATCDIYDGQLARAKGIQFKSGAFLDSTLDRIGEVAMFYGLSRYFRQDDLWFTIVFVAFAASQVVSYSRSRAEGLGFPQFGARGFFQRAERMIVLSVGMPFVPFLEYFWGTGSVLVKLVVLFVSAGSVQTAISRSWGIYRDIRKTEEHLS